MVSFAREEPAVLGREILGSEFSFVSRRQAVVSLEADDTVRLESVGANPTGIRAAGETKWRWLSKGQTAELSVGDEVALSRKVSAHSTLTLVAPSLLAIGSKKPTAEADVGTRSVAKAADASMAGAATSSQSVQWRWKSGSGWSDFSPSQSAAIEDAFVRGESAVAIDEERQVDLQQMRQLRFDDPSRFREVKRFPSKRSLTNTTGTADTNPDVPTLVEEPAAKRARTTVKGEGSAAPVMPSDAAPAAAPSAPSAPTAAFTAASDSIDASTAVSISTAFTASTCKFTAASSANAASSTSASTTSASTAAAAVQSLTPCDVPHSKKARWFPAHGEVLVRRADEEPRSKVAAFDMDGTLLQWKCKGYPSRLGDYELWSAEALETMRKLHGEGHKLVILSNQGGVRGAFTGKIATRFKGLVEWLEAQLQRPLHALAATIPKVSAYRKPATGMWSAMEEHTNGGVKVSIEDSLFVGDMAGRAGDASSSDRDFASNVGSERGAVLPFLTPEAAFGPAAGGAKAVALSAPVETSPAAALAARRALLGGYLSGPLMLLLCGGQGSGKSFACAELLACAPHDAWVVVCQDTIANGKPGKREKCEAKAREALAAGRCVLIDRMHLEPSQREPFVAVAAAAGVPVHALVLQTSPEEMARRVRERVDHPGGVQGEAGARFSARSKLAPPTYTEGFTLLSFAALPAEVSRICALYAQVRAAGQPHAAPASPPPASFPLNCGGSLPALCLGTMKLRGDALRAAASAPFGAIDTAPTYENEKAVGEHVAGRYLIVKVPHKAVDAAAVRQAVGSSLQSLRRKACDLLLLHWPANAMSNGSLAQVWNTMEALRAEGVCTSIGVCNFTPAALAALLAVCSVPPAVNQVERHPLLPQWELLDFCVSKRIVVQAHSPLGQGRAELLQHEVIRRVAQESGLSPAQVLLQWNLRHGVAVVPKCSSVSHATEILNSVAPATTRLSPAQMELIDTLAPAKKRFVNPPFMSGGLASSSFAW